jgi:uncharacterized protein (TIGR03437 family)
MCRRATIRALAAASLLAALNWSVLAQPVTAQPVSMDWRHIGNSAIELSLPSVATGPVDRAWYSPDGSVLYIRTVSGRIFSTDDFEQWRRLQDPGAVAPPESNAPAISLPERSLKLTSQAPSPGRFYAVGRHVYRSDDAGASWANLTAYKGDSILGDGLSAVAASPRDPDEVVVASSNGVWRSVDGGLSWTGLNQFLPNLPAGKLMGIPNGLRGVRLSVPGHAAEIEWAPGEKAAWKPSDPADVKREDNLKAALSQQLRLSVTAIATAKDYIYAGDAEGRLVASPDAGASWPGQNKLADTGRVEAIWVDPNDPLVAVAVLGARPASAPPGNRPIYVLRTTNGGNWWLDITMDLPENAVGHGVTADRASGAIYIATSAGVFLTTTNLAAAGQPTAWSSLGENLPATAATDVRLDAGANQLYAALDGYGVYATIAPHRFRDARVVSAADYSSRPAAPGALLSILGARIASARSANLVVPVLDASDKASQIQVPFEAKGNTLPLAFEAAAGRFTFGLPLQSVSPAIFVDPEGTPLIMDADSGILLDAGKPAHANTRIQVLSTGFGRVKPDWPTGLAAPLNDPPRVAAQVHAYLDRIPLEITQAVLAPGYIGFYLIEIQLPQVLNAGPAELVLEAEGQQSNRVRLYIQP